MYKSLFSLMTLVAAQVEASSCPMLDHQEMTKMSATELLKAACEVESKMKLAFDGVINDHLLTRKPDSATQVQFDNCVNQRGRIARILGTKNIDRALVLKYCDTSPLSPQENVGGPAARTK